MSTLYLATDIETLTHRLAKNLDQALRGSDFFQATTIVVPHRSLGQWLRLWLARQQGVAINLQIGYLESALWEMLREVDPRQLDPVPEVLDGEAYRLLVLTILLENSEPGLEYWQRFLRSSGVGAGSRARSGAGEELPGIPAPDLAPALDLTAARFHSRRLWNLAGQLSTLIRDYEYHRQDGLIQPWLRDELGLDKENAELETAERAIFRAITRLDDGKRALLNQATHRNFKTLPQYAMEVIEHYSLNKLRDHATPRLRTVHLFGLTQISALHTVTLRWLGRFFDLQVYYLNALASRERKRPEWHPEGAPGLRSTADPATHAPPILLHDWGQAGAESLHTMTALCAEPRYFSLERLQSARHADHALPLFAAGRVPTVLARLQDHLKNDSPSSEPRIPQDRSLQIIGCPGPVREVETVYQSILANLQEQPDLKQSDIAVLATDMEQYRQVLQAAFDRSERRVLYNLDDFSAAGVSMFGQALLGMLDLALDSFTRSGVFGVLLNPCFLARLGIDRGQGLVWLNWVQKLGIYQNWDQGEKNERGYADSPLFSWRLGLQRLRLGRIMEPGRDDGLQPSPRFGMVVPFSDIHSGNPEELNDFCLAVERLLPRLTRLRRFQGSAQEWVDALESLMQDFLEIPEDRPEETDVRSRLLSAVQQWAVGGGQWAEKKEGLTAHRPLPTAHCFSLPLIREMTASALEGIEGVRGPYLAGGVTIAALQPLKPLPFRIVYMVGLGEEIFPGSNVLSGLDLRRLKALPGDIRPAEQNRYLFLETLLAVRDKVYLLYNNLDIQRDRVLHPCVPLQQMKRYLSEQILTAPFEEVQVPLLPSDERYLGDDKVVSTTDVLVQFDETDRLLSLASFPDLTEQQQAEVAQRLQRRRMSFSLAQTPVAHAPGSPTVTLHDLANFLRNPINAARRLLRIDVREQDELVDDEPFVSDNRTANEFMRQVLDGLVLRSVEAGVQTALDEFDARFKWTNDQWTLQNRMPDEAFGKVDRIALKKELEQRIWERGIAKFLQCQQEREFCGPMLIGESLAPLGARQRFTALTLNEVKSGEWGVGSGERGNVPGHSPLRIVGSVPLVWRSDTELDILLWHFGKKARLNDLARELIDPALFWMALKAGGDGPNCSRDWLGGRACRIHLAHAGGFFLLGYGAEEIDSATARDYLAELAGDYLDPSGLDNLPLDLILNRAELRKAVKLDAAASAADAEAFQTALAEQLEDETEEGPWKRRTLSLAQLLDAQVPADALAKVRRRFRPLRIHKML